MAFIEPGSPWEIGYCESFNAKLRDELLDGEIFYSLAEAKTVIESWRPRYNTRRPHSSLGDKPPAPAAIVPSSNMAAKPSMHEIEAGPLNRGRPVRWFGRYDHHPTYETHCQFGTRTTRPRMELPSA